MAKNLGICGVGTTIFNTVSYCPQVQSGRKIAGEIREMAAGVGLNSMIAATAVAAAIGRNVHTRFVTEMGPASAKNHYRYAVENLLNADLAKIGENARFDILDMQAGNPDFRLINIPITVETEKSGARHNVQPPPQSLTQIFNATKARDMIVPAIEASDVLVLNSRMIEQSCIAASIAYRNNIPVILDLNSEDKGFIESPQLEDVLRYASHLLVPAEAVIPGRMCQSDPAELEKVLLRYYGEDRFIAISDGGDPVKVFINREPQESFTPPRFTSKTPDTLGCGDARTGAFAALVGAGIDSNQAIRAASALATFTGNYRLRDWLDTDIRDELITTIENHIPHLQAA